MSNYRLIDVISKLISKEIVFETNSGSIGLATDDDGRLRIGGIDAPGTSNTLVIDPINNKIQTANITFSDGTYLDSAAGLGISNPTITLFQIKTNKVFFKYNQDDTPLPNQYIEINVNKTSDITGSISFSFSPNPNNDIQLVQIDSDTWRLTQSEFAKSNSETLEITATIDSYSDSVNIFKAKDGSDALVGGLTNPITAIQTEADGTINQNTLQTFLQLGGGTFTVLKGEEDLTGNSSRISYSIESITDQLTASINSSGIYTISNFNVAEETGQIIFVATDLATQQQIRAKYSIFIIKRGETGAQGATGPTGPTGATGPAGSAGLSAKTVKLAVDDAQIAYLANDTTPAPTQIALTASQQNHNGTVYYEFVVYEGGASSGISLVNSTSNNILLTNTSKNYGSGTSYNFIESTKTLYGKSKTIKVVTRENSSSSAALSEDSVTIIATKDGSDSMEIVFPNNNHTFPAANDGSVLDYTGGGSIVEAYIGNEQLTPTTNATIANGEFKVAVDSISNIKVGTLTTDVANKRYIVGDPYDMSGSSDVANITYIISGKDSKGISKNQLAKVSYTKSKKGDTGASGFNGLLTNESHTIAANNDGSIYNFSSNPLDDADGYFRVYSGNLLLVSGVSYSVVGSATKNGLTISINSSSGYYTLSTASSSSWTSNSETFTLRAQYGTTIIEKDYSITKSLGGANAKILRLVSTSQTFKKDTGGLYSPTSQTITFTAILQNISGVVTWTVNGQSAGSNLTTVNGTSVSLSQAQFDTLRTTNTFITIKATADGFSDETTIQLIQDGAKGDKGTDGTSAKTLRVSVDSQIFSFDDVADTTPTPTSIIVTINQQNLTGPINASNITILNSSGQSITVPTFTSTTSTGTGTTIFELPYSATNLNDKSKLPISVEVSKDSVSDKITIYKIEGGSDGVDGATVILTNESHTFQASNSGVISSFLGGGTDIKVFIGTTELTADASTEGYPASLNSFSVAVTSIFPASFITLGTKSASGTTMTFADPTAFSQSVDGGTVKYTVKVRDANNATRTFDKIQSFTKSKTGAAGVDGQPAINGLLSNESHTIAASSSGQIVNFSSTVYNTAGGLYSIYNGNTLVSTGITFSVSGASSPNNRKIQNGLTASIDSAGLYYITSSTSTGWSSDAETFVFRAVTGSTTIDKSYTIVKSKGGANAKILSLNSTALTFKKDTAGIYTPSNQTISLTASLQNITTPITWSINGSTTGAGTNGSSGVGSKLTVSNDAVSASLSSSQFEAATGSNSFVTVKAQTTDSGTTYSDQTTIQLISDGAVGAAGSSAKLISISVDKQFFSFDDTTDLTADPSQINFTINQQNLTGPIISSNITITNSSGQSIAVPTLNSSVTNGTGNVTFSLLYSTTNLNDKTKLPISITVSKDGVSDTITIYKVEGGNDGADGATVILTNESHTFPSANDGTVSLYTGGGTDIKVFLGTTELNADASTTNTPLNINTFTIGVPVLSPANFITLGNKTANATTLTFADPSAMSASVDTGTITYPIQVKDATGTLRTFNKVQSFTKSKTGAQGATGATGATGPAGSNGQNSYSGLLTNESHTIAASSSGEIFGFSSTVFNPGSGSFKVYDGSTLKVSGVTYTIVGASSPNNKKIQNGLTASIDTSGLYTVTSSTSTGWTTNSETFIFNAQSGTLNIDKSYTIVKSLGGANAKILVLNSNAENFKKDTTGNYSPSSQTIAFTASLQNFTSQTVQWTVNGGAPTSLTIGTNTLSASFSQSQFDTARGSTGFTTIRASITENSITYYDEITVNLITDGAAGVSTVNGILTNESHTIAASSSGEIVAFSSTIYNTAGGTYNFYNGTSLVPTNQITYSVVSPSIKNGLTASINSSGVYSLTSSTSTGWTSDTESFTFRAVSGSGAGTVTLDKDYTITKSKGGANAKILFLNVSSLTFKKDTTGAYSPLTQEVALTASLQNFTTQNVQWQVDSGTPSALTIGTNTLSASINQSSFNGAIGSKGYVKIKAYIIESGITYYDEATISVLQDGAAGTNAINGLLTNEAFTIAASSSGEIVNFSSTVYNQGSGSFNVYNGNTLISTSLLSFKVGNSSNAVSGTPSSIIQNGLTASIDTSGIYRVTSSNSTGWTSDSESFLFTATSGSSTINKSYTIVKSKGGVNAKILALSSTGLTFKKDTVGAYSPTVQQIDFTASLQNITTPVTWSVDDDATAPGVGVAGSIGTKLTVSNSSTNRLFSSMTASQFTAATGSKNFTKVKAAVTEGGITYSDVMTITLLQDGAKGDTGASGAAAKLISLSVNNQIFSFANSGSTTPIPTSIAVTASQQNLSTALIASDFTIKDFSNATVSFTPSLTTNVTNGNGTVTFTLPYSTINDKTKFPITITATKESVSDNISVYALNGGSDTLNVIFSNESHTFSSDTSGNVGNYAGSGTDIKVLLGTSELTASATVGDPVNNNSFTVSSITVTPAGFVTYSPADPRTVPSTSVLRINEVATVSNSVDSGYVTFTIKVKDSNGKITTLTKDQVFSKSKQGVQGIQGIQGANAINGLLTNESFTIAASSSGEIVNFSSTVYNQGSGSFNLYNGSTLISTSLIAYAAAGGSGNAVAGTPSRIIQNGLTASIDNTGIYKVTSSNSTGWTSDNESFLFTATSGSSTVNKTYTIVKSKGGANAKILSLSSTGLTFKKDTVGAYSPASQTIAFTASLQNITTPITWSVDSATTNVGNGTGGAGTGTIFTVGNNALSGSMTQAQFTAATGSKNFTTVRAAVTEGGVTYSDSMTVTLLQDGAQGTAGINGADGIDTGLIFDFSQTFTSASINRPYGWNNSSIATTDITTATATTSQLRPSYEPSGGLSYPTDVTSSFSTIAQYGGALAVLSGSNAGTGQWFRYFYTAEPIPVGINNTYEVSYRLKIDSTNTTASVGLFFFDVTGTLINTIDTAYAQTAFPHVIEDGVSSAGVSIPSSFTATVTKYYSFESGGSLKTFPPDTRYVKPFIRLRSNESSGLVKKVLIDKLYFGEKTTPNTRNGIFIDSITGRIAIGAATADVAGGSGGLTDKKYDAVANFEIITGSGASDIRITRGYSTAFGTTNSAKSNIDIGVDFAALRFAGWNGTFQGTDITNPGNMVVDERAAITATYMRTGSSDQTGGALGGASLDFYTAPSRTTASFLGTNATLTGSDPLLRARITDQGQFLVGYSDASAVVSSSNLITNITEIIKPSYFNMTNGILAPDIATSWIKDVYAITESAETVNPIQLSIQRTTGSAGVTVTYDVDIWNVNANRWDNFITASTSLTHNLTSTYYPGNSSTYRDTSVTSFYVSRYRVSRYENAVFKACNIKQIPIFVYNSVLNLDQVYILTNYDNIIFPAKSDGTHVATGPNANNIRGAKLEIYLYNDWRLMNAVLSTDTVGAGEWKLNSITVIGATGAVLTTFKDPKQSASPTGYECSISLYDIMETLWTSAETAATIRLSITYATYDGKGTDITTTKDIPVTKSRQGAGNPTKPTTRDLITGSQGNAFVLYADSATDVIINKNALLSYTYLYANNETYPKLTVSGGVYARNFVSYDSTVENYLTGTLYTSNILPISTTKINYIYNSDPNTYVSTVSQEYFSNNSTLGDSKNRWANGFINTIYLGNTALTNDEPVAALNDANIYVSIKNKFSNWRINNYLSIDTGSWSSGGALTWDHTFTWPNVITDNSFTIEKSTTSITESQTLPTSWQKCLIIDNNGDTTITGDLTLTNGNVIIGSTGKGIDFSVTAEGVAGVSGSLGGEILNDYEEGTFTPYLEGTTTAGTWSYTYNAGYYTKIGDTVIINGAVDVISTAGSVGQILMKGFPFVSRTAGLGIYPFTVSWTTFTTAIDRLNLILGTNSSTAGFSYSIGTVTNSENTNLSGSNIGSGRIRFSGVYKTNS